MEIREWALTILEATTLEDKLLNPKSLTDLNPGNPYRFPEPLRPQGLAFKTFSKKDKLPSFEEHGSQDKRAICLHRFAGHELLAVELMAFALLAFPQAPKHFRKGLANTLKEEQWHVKIYQKRLEELGCSLDSMPFNNRFWKLTPFMKTPLDFINIMHLTLEMANLDFAPLYGASFKRHGDLSSADLMETIYKDEIAHVGFGYQWLKKLKPKNFSAFETYLSTLGDKIPVKRAKGFVFLKEPRIKAGLPEDYINALEKA